MNIFKTKNSIEIYTPKRSKIHLFSKFFRTNISHNPHNPHKKECAMKFSQPKKDVPDLKFCILFYKIYKNYIRADFTCSLRQYVFQNHVKSRN